jgi:hypothetical protein
MNARNIVLAGAAAAGAVAVIAAGTAMAKPETAGTPVAAQAVAAAAVGTTGSTAASSAAPTTSAGSAGDPALCAPGGPGHDHTPVTGAERAKVTAAIAAKDKSVTVTDVWKDPDGSYDAAGTKDDAPVRVEVSADLKTVTVQAGMRGPGPDRGRHGGFGPVGSPVTGAELTKVTAAITAKDKAVTVDGVVKLEDGSYRAFGTKDGDRVHVEVSKDLKTVTIETGRPGR